MGTQATGRFPASLFWVYTQKGGCLNIDVAVWLSLSDVQPGLQSHVPQAPSSHAVLGREPGWDARGQRHSAHVG